MKPFGIGIALCLIGFLIIVGYMSIETIRGRVATRWPLITGVAMWIAGTLLLVSLILLEAL